MTRIAWLTPEMQAGCRPGAPGERASGAIASIACPLPVELPASSVHHDLFDQPAVILTAFDAYVEQHGSPTGDCSARAPWGTAPGASSGFPSGMSSATRTRGRPWESCGPMRAGAVQASWGPAIREDDDWALLYEWWRSNHPLMAH